MSHLDRATQPHGLATTGGRVSTTGVGGFTLGGGIGLARAQVRAGLRQPALGRAGDRRRRPWCAPARTENPELFWALHGGGGNFGVATSLTLRLHPLPAVTAALLLWPPGGGPEVVRAYRDFIEAAPDEVGGGLIYLTGPPEEFVPAHLVGQLACAVAGDLRRAPRRGARESLAPLLALRARGGR